MHILLLTGIYPPELGGPATYSRNLALGLTALGHTVTVLTYGEEDVRTEPGFSVHFCSRKGGVICRYVRMRRLIAYYSATADIVYSFDSVSVGIPLLLSGTAQHKKVLRLGGDFAWERYTDYGGTKPLPEFYTSPPLFWRLIQWCVKPLILQQKHVVFSTQWQQKIYEQYIKLPSNSCIQNAVTVHAQRAPHILHLPVQLLCFTRLVAFKNIGMALRALKLLPDAQLTIAGDGPLFTTLQAQAKRLQLEDRVQFLGSIESSGVAELFRSHDVLLVPSYSDISPNAALEAVASGLPVIITHNNGLSALQQQGMHVCDTRTPEQVVAAVQHVRNNYEALCKTLESVPERPWKVVALEHVELFKGLKQLES